MIKFQITDYSIDTDELVITKMSIEFYSHKMRLIQR